MTFKMPKYAEAMIRTGSREICNPPPTDTDEDWLIYTTQLADLQDEVYADGFRMGAVQAERYPDSETMSWRKGEINLIITASAEEFDLWETATKLAKKFNLLKKEDRIRLFHAIRTGEWLEDRDLKINKQTQPRYERPVETRPVPVRSYTPPPRHRPEPSLGEQVADARRAYAIQSRNGSVQRGVVSEQTFGAWVEESFPSVPPMPTIEEVARYTGLRAEPEAERPSDSVERIRYSFPTLFT